MVMAGMVTGMPLTRVAVTITLGAGAVFDLDRRVENVEMFT